jgi:V/A-type H+/Na+-transporting ATPase subunit D
MTTMATDIKPTRNELLKLKKQLKLAIAGHSLLKKKRDGLILEFFDLLKKSKTARSKLVASFITAKKSVNIARVMHTDLKIHSIALAQSSNPSITLELKNIMGVSVPKIQSQIKRENILNQGIGAYSSTAIIDKATISYEELIDNSIVVAETETAMKRLLDEIKKTKRRVNALEFNRIPAMQADQKFIQLRLEEMERENTFRLKRIKAK